MAFFDAPQGAAILKHRLLNNYLGVFVGKLGSTSAGRRVVFIDGYAGPGHYDDESPGSPALAADTAARLSLVRNLELRFIEEDQAYYEALCERLADEPTAQVVHGTAEDHLYHLVADAGDAPLLVFLDPYGLAIPFTQLVETVLNRPQPAYKRTHRPTEVILNYSIAAVRRFTGWLDKRHDDPKTTKTQQTFIVKLDTFFGGDWWQEIRRREDDDWEEQILHGYLDRLCAAASHSWTWRVTRVSDRFQGPTSYYLALLTQNRHGLWAFNNASSLGQDALREHTAAGQQEIDPNARKRLMIDEIVENLRRMLAERSAFVLMEHTEAVYGSTLSYARETHVRQALNRLHDRGEISVSPKGEKDLGPFRVVRAI